MPKRTTITWTCTRCGKDQVFNADRRGLTEPDTGPLGWVRIYTVKPCAASLLDKGIVAGDFCNSCLDDFERWIVAPLNDPEPADAAAGAT